MRRATLLALPVLLLVGCGGGDAPEQAEATATTAALTTSSSPTTSSADTGVGYDLELAVDICTTGLATPDTLIFDAATAARAGTRSVTEIADMFREAQDGVEVQADRAEDGEMPRLAQSLQTYADTLGQARVSGTGLDAIAAAREAINAACFLPDSPAT